MVASQVSASLPQATDVLPSAWLQSRSEPCVLSGTGKEEGKNSGPVPSSTFNDRCDHAGVRRSRWKHFSARTHAGLDTSLNERVYLGSVKEGRRKKGQRRGGLHLGPLELHRLVMIFKETLF